MKDETVILKESLQLQKLLRQVLNDTKIRPGIRKAAYHAIHGAMEALAWVATVDNISLVNT